VQTERDSEILPGGIDLHGDLLPRSRWAIHPASPGMRVAGSPMTT
jgi:hypothetical protein